GSGTVADTSLDSAFSSDEISVDVETNRVSGIAPLAVFFDATGTTHTDASIEPFLDLHYQWYFHDSSPTSGGAWEYSCKSKQVASGPMSAHVFDDPGEYTVRLAVRDRAGNVTSTTIDIRVTSPEAVETYCVADIESGGDFSGCPLDADGDGMCEDASRCIATDDVLVALSGKLGGGKRVLFRRGDVFAAATLGLWVQGDGGVIGAFGDNAEARPIWQYRSTANDTITALHFSGASDWRFMDIDIVGDPNSANSVAAFDMADCENVLLYRLGTRTWRGFGMATHFGPSTRFSENIFIVDVAYSEQFKPGGGWAAFLELEKSAVMGLLLEDTSAGEGGYRSMHSRKFLLQHSRIQRPAPFKQNISIRSCDSEPESYDDMCTAGLPTEELIISDNVLIATEGSGAMNVPPGPHRRYIIERNFVHNDTTVTSDYLIGFLLAEIDGLAFRNNIVDLTVDDTGGRDVYMISGGSALEVYNNTLHWRNEGGLATLCSLEGGTCSNNLLYAPGADRYNVLEGDGTAENNLLGDTDFDGLPFPEQISFPPLARQFVPIANRMPSGPVLSTPAAIDDFLGHIRTAEGISAGAGEYTP
ncbi:MAG: PKD domain-containing protein, partial [Nannocystaceae bacterium]